MRECRDLFVNRDAYNETEELITPGQLVESPITLFVKYLLIDKDYENEEVIRLTSNELLSKFNQFTEKHKIVYKVNSISLIIQIKKLKLNCITTIKCR